MRIGDMTIEISGTSIPIKYEDKPEGDKSEPCFSINGDRYYFSDFMRCEELFKNPAIEFHGYLTLTAFHGMLVQISDDTDTVNVYHYGT